MVYARGILCLLNKKGRVVYMKDSTARKIFFEETYNDNVIMFPGTDFKNGEADDFASLADDKFLNNLILDKLTDVAASAGCIIAFAYIMFQVFNWLLYV